MVQLLQVGAELLRTRPDVPLLLIVHEVHSGEELVSHRPAPAFWVKVQLLMEGLEFWNHTPCCSESGESLKVQ